MLAERAAGRPGCSWGLLALGRGVPRAGMEVRRGEQVLGTTTSGTFSPVLRQGIALALLDADGTGGSGGAAGVAEGDELVVDVRGRPLPVRVVRPPFVPDRSRA